MDSRWFMEDRKLPKDQQSDAIEESKKALRNSTLLTRRLKAILEDEMRVSEIKEEDFDNPNWERIHVSEIARRKTLRQVINLIDFKEADRGR